MPRNTYTLDLQTEAQQLDNRLDELADTAAEADPGTDEFTEAAQSGQQVEQHLAAVEDAIDEYGADATWTIAELKPGEYAEFADMLDAARSQLPVGSEGEHMAAIYWVAAGLIEAPFLEPGDDLQTRVQKVRDELTRQFLTWLKGEITDKNTLSVGNGRSFAERVAARTSTTGDT